MALSGCSPTALRELEAPLRDNLQKQRCQSDDPDDIVAFLCSKFSVVIDSVQAAEARETSSRRRCEELERELAKASEIRKAGLARFQGALTMQKGGAENASESLLKAQASASRVVDELRRTREQAQSGESVCEQLSMRVMSELQCAREAEQGAAYGDEAWTTCERERLQLKEEGASLSAKLVDLEQSLAMYRERETHRKADVRALEDRTGDAHRARRAADRRAAQRREETSKAIEKLDYLREQVANGLSVLTHCETELEAETAEMDAAVAADEDLQEQQVAMEQSLHKLSKAKTALEQALREDIAVREQMKVTSCVLSAWCETGSSLEERHRGLEESLQETVESIVASSTEVSRLQQRLETLRGNIEESKVCQQGLEHESVGASCVGLSLQDELQRMFNESEVVQAEREDLACTCDKLQKQLLTAEPALETTRRRVQELEQSIQDMEGDAERAKQHRESLVRELNQSRDKMRALRRRHGQLQEKSQALEKRLLRSSGTFGGTAGFAAVATEGLATKSAVRRSSSTGIVPANRLRVNADSAPTARCAAPPTPDSREPSVSSRDGFSCPASAANLVYLRDYVESEQARLGQARRPPTPTPAPGSNCKAQGLAVEPSDLERFDCVSYLPHGESLPKSAVALAALSSGASAVQAVALLGVDSDDRRTCR